MAGAIDGSRKRVDSNAVEMQIDRRRTKMTLHTGVKLETFKGTLKTNATGKITAIGGKKEGRRNINVENRDKNTDKLHRWRKTDGQTDRQLDS